MVDSPAGPAYDERLGVPLRWWAQGTMLVASLWLAVVVAVPSPGAWVVTAIAFAVLVLVLLGYGSARVTVADGELRAGRAHIALRHVGEVTPLGPQEARATAGVRADARAYLLLRPYLKQAVRVEITDPADPTPYWLIGTRRPDDLSRALRESLPTSEDPG